MKKNKGLRQIIVFQAKSGAIELRGDISRETIWATQAQIAEVFQAERSVITKHIRNILEDKELDASSVCAKFAHTADDGKIYYVQFYNLDIILAVGYRTNSKRAIEFRKWATKTLREHIIKGYTINRKRIAENYSAFMKSVSNIQALLPDHITLDPKAILDLVKEFSSTWVSLDAYDKDTIKTIGTTKKSIKLSGEELTDAIESFRLELIKSGKAGDIFAQERDKGMVSGIVGNVMQSFGKVLVYKSVEEQAAHLLYFMIKDHPFVDGNKRIGAFAFIWFLRKAKAKKLRNINSSTLTTLTLLIAESDSKKKEQMTALITQLLK